MSLLRQGVTDSNRQTGSVRMTLRTRLVLIGLGAFVAVVFVALGLLAIGASSNNHSPTGAPVVASQAEEDWNKELTDGVKSIYGDKVTKKDRRAIKAMSVQAAKTYGEPPKDDDGRDE